MRTKAPRLEQITVRQKRYGYRAFVRDELGYWWFCDFEALPDDAAVLSSWREFTHWQRSTEDP